MGDFTTMDVLRSIGSAAVLILNDINPWEGYSNLNDQSLHSGGRLAFQYQGQTFPMTYGPMGTYIYPGISVEGGDVTGFKDDKFKMPVILCVTREIKDTPEIDQHHLDNMTKKLDKWIKVDNNSPVYYFGSLDEHNAVVGTVSWYTNSMAVKPVIVKYVGVPVSGGWIRKEYNFETYFTNVTTE